MSLPLLAEGTDAGAPAVAAAPDAAAGRRGILWWIPAVVVLVDQLTKLIVLRTLPLAGSVTVIPGFADFTHVRNPGVAFGLLAGGDLPYQALVTSGLALLALAGIAYYARHLRPNETLARIGLSLILGGAIGNLIDRLRVGYVVDFIDLYRGDWHFWAFNVADTSITIGAVLVFLDLLLVKRDASHPV